MAAVTVLRQLLVHCLERSGPAKAVMVPPSHSRHETRLRDRVPMAWLDADQNAVTGTVAEAAGPNTVWSAAVVAVVQHASLQQLQDEDERLLLKATLASHPGNAVVPMSY